MANLQFNNFNQVCRKFVGKIQTAESVRISVKDDIAQVISTGVDSCVTSYEITGDNVALYGKTNIRFLYSDGTATSSSSYNADFTANMQADLPKDSKLTFEVATQEVKADTNANTATITILLEVSVYCYSTSTTPYLCSSDDAFTTSTGAEVLTNAIVSNYTTVVDQQLQSSMPITTVLLCESALCPTDYTLHENVLNVVGKAIVRLTYVSNQQIVTDSLTFDFQREIEAPEIPSDSQLRLKTSVRSNKIRLDIDTDKDNDVFNVEIVANVAVEATQIAVVDIVGDAYSTNCDYVLTKRPVCTTLPCGSSQANKTVTLSLDAPANYTYVTAVNVGTTVVGCTSMEHSASVQGIVSATLLFSTDTGIVGKYVEMPFNTTVDIDFLMPACKSFAHAVLTDLQIEQADKLDVTCQLCIYVDAQRDVEYQVIVSADEVPFDKSQLPAIQVCLANKGETIWQLAKSLHLSQEELLATNPELTNPLQEDARIVIYNKI